MKKTRHNKTKEQIIDDMKKRELFKEKMDFTKNKFYPALCAASRNIDDAKQLVSSLNSMMMDKFLGFMKEKKFSDLDLHTLLDPKEEKYQEYIALLALFSDMSVFDAKYFIEGMRNEIDFFLREEQIERPLSSLKPKWLDEKLNESKHS